MESVVEKRGDSRRLLERDCGPGLCFVPVCFIGRLLLCLGHGIEAGGETSLGQKRMEWQPCPYRGLRSDQGDEHPSPCENREEG